MITIEDTDAAVKRCEQYLQRAATDEGSPKAELAEVDLAVVVGVVSAGHAKMLNTVKDKNRGSQDPPSRCSRLSAPI